MQSVNKTDSWSQFMQVVQDARGRGGATNAKQVGSISGPNRGSQLYASAIKQPVIMHSTMGAASLTKASAKIVGGLFDAYA